jgi:hypothetical protein
LINPNIRLVEDRLVNIAPAQDLTPDSVSEDS